MVVLGCGRGGEERCGWKGEGKKRRVWGLTAMQKNWEKGKEKEEEAIDGVASERRKEPRVFGEN